MILLDSTAQHVLIIDFFILMEILKSACKIAQQIIVYLLIFFLKLFNYKNLFNK